MGTIYESDLLLKTHFGSMHPGGLRLTDRAVRLAALNEGMRVADIGCGTGATAAFLRDTYKLNVTGLDMSDKLIGVGLRSWPDLSLIRWSGEALPFEDNSLDAVLFECTLSLLGDVKHILEQCAKAMTKTGTVIISDIYAKNHMSAPPFTFLSLTETLEASGFKIIIREDHTAALRTYAAELWNTYNTGISDCGTNSASAIDTGSFFGASCQKANIRLSGLVYMLTIARKT